MVVRPCRFPSLSCRDSVGELPSGGSSTPPTSAVTATLRRESRMSWWQLRRAVVACGIGENRCTSLVSLVGPTLDWSPAVVRVCSLLEEGRAIFLFIWGVGFYRSDGEGI